jgi:hypothetical protein
MRQTRGRISQQTLEVNHKLAGQIAYMDIVYPKYRENTGSRKGALAPLNPAAAGTKVMQTLR